MMMNQVAGVKNFAQPDMVVSNSRHKNREHLQILYALSSFFLHFWAVLTDGPTLSQPISWLKTILYL